LKVRRRKFSLQPPVASGPHGCRMRCFLWPPNSANGPRMSLRQEDDDWFGCLPDLEPQNWLLHHKNYQGHRFSARKQIDTSTSLFAVRLHGGTGRAAVRRSLRPGQPEAHAVGR
jgi:hypothetical protein